MNIPTTLDPEMMPLARHALGLPNKSKTSYRNYFVTGPGGSDHRVWIRMVDAGLAGRRKGSELTGGDDLFWLTKRGATAALSDGEKLDPEDFPDA